MPTVTATAFPAEAYVLVQADWNDVPAVTHARMVRINTVTGEEVYLRPYVAYDGDGYLLLNCGEGLWWDTEPPLNVLVQYRTEAAPVLTALTTNDSFETGVFPWLVSGGVLTQSAVFSHSGAFSGLLTPSGLSNAVIANPVDQAFVAGETLVLSAWVLSPQGFNAVYLQSVNFYDDGIVEVIESNIEIIDDGEWRYIEVTFEPRTSGLTTGIQFTALGVPPATTLFYIDEIKLSQRQPVAATALSNTVTVVSDSLWLKNPFFPCLDVEIGVCDPSWDGECDDDARISYVGMEDDERPANTNLLVPANRPYAIPINRERRAPNSVLRLLAHDCDARDAIVAINQPGNPLLFQAKIDGLPDSIYCIEDRYISVATLTESRFSVDQRDPFRLMTMPYATVERPAGPANGPCGLRIRDLCDIYTSWQSMTIAGLTWEDLLLGAASNNSPGDDPALLRIWSTVESEFANWLAVEGGGTRDWSELRDGL